MSPLCGIFPNRVFERPYNDLTTFSQVSCTLNLKNTCRKTLKTSLAAHCEKTRPEITPGSENHENTTPIEVQMDDLSATTAHLFSPEWPFGRHMGTKIEKNTSPACILLEKSLKLTHITNPRASKVVKIGSHCSPDQLKPKIFQMGAFL